MARKQPEIGLNLSKEQVMDERSVPEVLRSYRSKAWQVYQDIPFPTLKDEAWRRTSLRGFDFGSVKLANGKTFDKEIFSKSLKVVPESIYQDRSIALMSPAGVEVKLSKAVEKSGVIFSSLSDAAEKHPDLVEKIIGKIVSPDEGKFAAAIGAFASHGLFIYVPKGVHLKEPLFSISLSGTDGTVHFFQTLIYLEENTSLNYLQESISPYDLKNPALTGENLEIYVGQNAQLRIAEIQNYSDLVWGFGHKKALVERDGNIEWEIGALGSALSKYFVSLDLVGEGAEGRVSGMFLANKDQHLSFNTLQRHLAPRTTSDLLFKGALNGNSRSVWRGMIYVAPGARFIDGYQANRNLLLDPSARSDSIPGLEILNNDVRCTHGSTVGKIDQEQLFYMLSRGIPQKEAERLIIQGFFDDILSRFSLEEVRENLWRNIESKLLV